MKSFLTKIIILLLGFQCISSVAIGNENPINPLPKIKVNMMLEHEGFLTWYAIKKGWDRQLGFEIDLEISDISGVEIMNKHNYDSKAWNISSVSSSPLIVAKSNSSFEIIGLANDESSSTKIYVNKESEILKHKGWNKKYPNVFGSPESIAEKTFYVKRLTSSEFVLAKWLEIFDLDFSDVILIDKSGVDSIDSMNNGSGEGMSIWSPATYDAEKQGYIQVASASSIDTEIPLMLIADKDFADNNEDLVAKFLAVYLKAVEAQEKGYKKLVGDYQEFLKLYAEKDYPKEFCMFDLKNHSVFNLEKQLQLFAKKGHRKSIVQKLERSITSSLVLFINDRPNDIDMDEKIRPPRNITDKYLKLSEQYLKSL